MKILKVSKAESLNGEIWVQGSKNAVLPMMAATLLTRDTVVLHNCPKISDVEAMIAILKYLGCNVKWEKASLVIQAARLKTTTIPETLTKSFRASCLFLGALLGRSGQVKTAYPGGCEIGKRPIDIHLGAFERLGVNVCEAADMVMAKGHISGNELELRYPSVGATENIVLASVCADGIVKINGASREPEIVALCELLNSMGADISGAGGHIITIRGVRRLHGCEYVVPGDRIVAGTYALAAIATGGKISIGGLKAADLAGQYMILSQSSVKMNFKRNTWYIEGKGYPKAIKSIKTGPFPEFPTDLQSPALAAMLRADGVSCIKETVYPDRFAVAKELKKTGACIRIEDDMAIVNGVPYLTGNRLSAKELRGAAGLVIAGLQAEGETFISGIEFLERGYEDICRDLNSLGADLTMISTDETFERRDELGKNRKKANCI